MVRGRVKEIMEENKVTIHALAQKAKLGTATIERARDERYFTSCRVYTLEAIAKALGCSIKDLFDEEP